MLPYVIMLLVTHCSVIPHQADGNDMTMVSSSFSLISAQNIEPLEVALHNLWNPT